jgi:protein-S-isoprenylcysteine O-methyltransferase Ste14
VATLRWLAVVLLVMLAAVLLGAAAIEVAGLPQRPRLPWPVRSVGLAVALAAITLAAWTFRHHPARLMARVTARTIQIALGKRSLESAVPRLITSGPYRLVRNPTYLSVVALLWGLGLAVPLTSLLVAGGIMLVWWNLLVIPAEERELSERFGAAYGEYQSRTGRFLPRLRARAKST